MPPQHFLRATVSDERILDIQREFNGLFLRGAEYSEVEPALRTSPWLLKREFLGNPPLWLCEAAKRCPPDVLALLLDSGCDVNQSDPAATRTPLSLAITFDNEPAIRLLLQRGADPNRCRSLIGALDPDHSAERILRDLSLLLEYGVDVNRVFPQFGDYDDTFTALDRAQEFPAARRLLLKHGARTAAEITGCSPGTVDPVIEFFTSEFGPVSKQSWNDPLPTGHPCCLHLIQPKKSFFRKSSRGPITLFTRGLSWTERKIPPGHEGFRRVELFVQLSGDFPLATDPQKEECMWPIRWLQRIADELYKPGGGLRKPLTIIPNGDPPRPLIAAYPFTCTLLLPERSFVRPDGQRITLQRMFPIHTSERDLQVREGSAALLKALESQSAPLVVDLNRPAL